MRFPVISSRLALTAGCAGILVLALAGSPSLAQNASDDLPPPRDATLAPPIRLVELIGRDYPMGQTADVMAAPSLGAASLVRVRQGATIKVVGLIEGNGWYQIELPDQRLAYVQVGAIPAASDAAAAQTPAPVAAAMLLPPPAPATVPTPPPPAAPVAAVASTTEPPPVATEEPTLDLPPTTEFDEASDQLSIVNPSAVYLAPDKRSPKAYPVKPGTMVDVIARSRDGIWAWVNTADGSPAYIPLADMGPLPAPPPPPPPQ